MAFREVSVVQVKEILRQWLTGSGERPIARSAGVGRGTARRYIAAAVQAGIERNGSHDQLTDEVIGLVCEAVRPSRPNGHGEGWKTLLAHEDKIKGWVEAGLTVTKIGVLLKRMGVDVSARTLARFCVERCGTSRRNRVTVRVDDPPPGTELQVDFGRLGLVPDGDRNRVCQALVFTAAYSRHMFVWPTFSMAIAEVIAGFEAAWTFFGGVFPVVIPDSMKTIIEKADNIAPRFNDTFCEYAQDRGFTIDPARIRSPQDKPRVERSVAYVQANFFAGEEFIDLADCRRRAQVWCREVAGSRIHGTTCLRPAEVFAAEEAPLLVGLPGHPFDIPSWSDPKVHRDFHVEVGRAIYSVSYLLVGVTLKARADSTTVKLFHKGELVKVHVRKPPGGRRTDPADMPPGKEIYATRDIEALKRIATGHGPSIGTFATQLLDTPYPWTRMRQVYRLLGLVKKWGADRVEAACQRALDAEMTDVNLVSRMIERAMEQAETTATAKPIVIQGRFARDPGEFAATAEEGR
jgi:transposase